MTPLSVQCVQNISKWAANERDNRASFKAFITFPGMQEAVITIVIYKATNIHKKLLADVYIGQMTSRWVFSSHFFKILQIFLHNII